MTDAKKLTDSELADARRLVEAAQKLVVDLCRTRGTPGSREWMMSIPARPDYDPDIVIGDALQDGARALDALDAQAREIEGLRTERDEARDSSEKWRAKWFASNSAILDFLRTQPQTVQTRNTIIALEKALGDREDNRDFRAAARAVGGA